MSVASHEAATAAAVAAHTPPSSPPSPSKWGPYSGAGDFGINTVIILILLFCALVLAVALNAVIRQLLCSFCHRHQSRDLPSDPEKGSNQKSQASAAESLPTLIFSASTKLAGTEAECSICLAEFADGDRIRILPACNHGFHVSCIEKWLVSRKSCPTCRTSCHVADVQMGMK